MESTLDCADAGLSSSKMARRQSEGLFVTIVVYLLIAQMTAQMKGGMQI